MKLDNKVSLSELKSSLMLVDNPARYAGAEFFYNRKRPAEGDIGFCMCFGDLYEIGMANNAVKIIFDQLNDMDGVFCDRAFSVVPDFEQLLKERQIPLFSEAECLPIKNFDMVGISIGSELASTNILQILDLSQIPLEAERRTEGDPILIAGGPAVTNPLPFSRFFDFIYIGESENGYDQIIAILKQEKTREKRIECLRKLPFLWWKGAKLAIRTIDNHFADKEKRFSHFVIPAFNISQDSGNVEIMRGCPNGCRFCHAGQYYKPYRQRSLETVYNLVKQEVDDFGYREITLASLSSGDYPELDVLIKILNHEFASRKVSFALPSLKVSSFSLDILQEISEVRRSGLTFAIETPLLRWQHAMNKEVPVEQVISIIKEAKQRGWKLAKFYFMVGLPFVDPAEEENAIVDYLLKIYQETHISMNINIGTFIPKPHTPFQWVAQMDMESSEAHLKSIKNHLKDAIRGIKVSYHEPFVSYLEGIISRGNEDTGLLIQKAYEKGARLDAWEDYLKPEIWKQSMEELCDFDFEKPIFTEHDLSEPLPWSSVSMGVSEQYLKNEYNKAKEGILTDRCGFDCNHRCGVCSKINQISEPDPITEEFSDSILSKPLETRSESVDIRQVILQYSKTGKAIFLSHINTMRAFEQAFQRSQLPIEFTQGFNPKPRLEFLNPVTLGITGDNELAMIEMNVHDLDESAIIERFNSQVCEGISVKKCLILDSIPLNGKKYSLASRLIGSIYEITDITDALVHDALCSFPNTDNQIKVFMISDQKFVIAIKGEKNLMKTVFPEMNKFQVTGGCNMHRLTPNINILENRTEFDDVIGDFLR